MRRHIIIGTIGLLSLSASAQNVSYNHDSSKMNQFTVAEIGSGGLTPSLYYTLLHKSYSKTAAAKNKQGFRTTASIAGYWQVDDAEKLDSAMIKRAEIEALNVADRQLDIAWQAEGRKIESKMGDFQRNINRIVPCGGSSSQRRLWLDRYNTLTTAIKATQEAYMPNSQRKKQYLQIYADAARANETLVKFLVYLGNGKSVRDLLAATSEKDNKNALIAAEAYGRWRDAGWTVSMGNKASDPFIGPIIPDRPKWPWRPVLFDTISVFEKHPNTMK